MTVRSIVISSALSALACSGAVAQSNPLSLGTVMGLPRHAGREAIQLSPDGTRLAGTYVLADRAAELAEADMGRFSRTGVPREALGHTVYVLDVRTGEHLELTGSGASSWAASWSPDGRHLAFYSDMDGVARVWLWDSRSRELRRAAAADNAVARPYFGFEEPRWSPDAHRLLVKLLPADLDLRAAAALVDGGAAEQAGARTFATNPSLRDTAQSTQAAAGFYNRSLADLAVIDIEKGSVERIARRARPMTYAFSPRANHVFYTDLHPIMRPTGSIAVAYNLVLLDLDREKRRVLADTALGGFGMNASWSPSGSEIAFVDRAGALQIWSASHPKAPVDEWHTQSRFARTRGSLASSYTPPLWRADGAAVYVAASDTIWSALMLTGDLKAVAAGEPRRRIIDIVGVMQSAQLWTDEAHSVTAVVRDIETMREGFATFPAGQGEAQDLWSADAALSSARFGMTVSADGSVAFLAQTATRPDEIWLSRDRLRTAERLSDFHGGLDAYVMGASRLLEWRSPEGTRRRAALVLPAGHVKGRRYPVVVRVYPESYPSASVHRFGSEQQLLATRGYAVLLPDIPAMRGQPGDEIAEAVLPAIDLLIQEGIADSMRIGITGTSAGGYATLALLTRSTRFAAAVAEQGFGNVLGYYLQFRQDGGMPGLEYVEEYGLGMSGTPWDDGMLTRHIEQSPLFQMDAVEAPVLLIHGESDRVVPPYLSTEVYVAMSRLGKPAVLVLYPGEDHGSDNWSNEHMQDRWRRISSWWNRWLGGTP